MGRLRGLLLLRHFIGALYSLERAETLGVKDRSGRSLPETYGAELQGVARALAVGTGVTEGGWLAGYYLNSAMYRVAALVDRLAKLLHPDVAKPKTRSARAFPEAKDLIDDVDKMKHNVAGILDGRKVTFDEALASAEGVGAVLYTVLSSA